MGTGLLAVGRACTSPRLGSRHLRPRTRRQCLGAGALGAHATRVAVPTWALGDTSVRRRPPVATAATTAAWIATAAAACRRHHHATAGAANRTDRAAAGVRLCHRLLALGSQSLCLGARTLRAAAAGLSMAATALEPQPRRHLAVHARTLAAALSRPMRRQRKAPPRAGLCHDAPVELHADSGGAAAANQHQERHAAPGWAKMAGSPVIARGRQFAAIPPAATHRSPQ